MQLPTLGQNQQSQQYYQQPAAPTSKKKFFLMIGGAVLLIITLLLVVFSGGNAGAQDMNNALQEMSETVGVIDDYESDVSSGPTKNDLALSQILLRGNLQKLDDLNASAFGAKKKYAASPKPDAQSKTELDKAARNNTLDSEIITVLQQKVAQTKAKLVVAKTHFSKKSSLDTVNKSISDLNSIEVVLAQPR